MRVEWKLKVHKEIKQTGEGGRVSFSELVRILCLILYLSTEQLYWFTTSLRHDRAKVKRKEGRVSCVMCHMRHLSFRKGYQY